MEDSFSLYNTSDVVDVVLFKYNYNDNKLWTLIKNKVKYIEVNNDSIIISTDQLSEIITNHFSNEINMFNATGYEVIHKEVNSIYFIVNMIKQMKQLRWIKITLNKNRSYSRIVKDINGNSQIKFGFKILHLTIKAFEFLNQKEIEIFNKVLFDQGLLSGKETYCHIKLDKLNDELDQWIFKMDDGDEIETENFESIGVITSVLDIFTEEKLSGDNPEVLLITDY
jgi:hypothetical protein